MYNNNNGQGGKRNSPHLSGGRPKSDADYGTKKKHDRKPQNAGRGDRGGRGGGSDRGPRGSNGGGNRPGNRPQAEMFSATCSTCHKSCQVPFRPDGSKPVLCSECFGKNKSDTRGGFDRNSRPGTDRPQRSFDAPRPPAAASPDYKTLLNQVSALETKVTKILEILQTTRPEAPVLVSKEEVVAVVAPKETATKKAVPKKVAAAKTAAKKTTKAAPKAAAQKTVVKKAVKKAAPKKVVAKKVVAKKAAPKAAAKKATKK